ncbi:MAG: anti-phage ZorAB system protein ZorA [Dechloromonas sp.]|nr:anti-phage ZorAB system protein ZorA [Dechloromonas sp.]
MDELMLFWHQSGAWLIAAVLLAITLGFVLRFLLPATLLARHLKRANAGLKRRRADPAPFDPDTLGELMTLPVLQHAWREYRQTLHVQSDPKHPAETRRWRSTAMAEDFFTEQSVVDTPLKTAFYKHLPGILTGIGIIGTFTGLIAGLAGFEVSGDPLRVRESLRVLILSVGQAFTVSAAAITLAMLITWLEKAIVTLCYRRVGELVQQIDSLFDAGVGEEYLARLVRAAEHSAAQASRLQQTIATELRQGMAAMLAEQQAAVQRQQAQLAGQIAQAVAASVGHVLQTPLERMSAAVERLGGEQNLSLSQTLAGVLEHFQSRLDDTFGQRQDGLESLLAHTADSLTRAAGELSQVAGRLNQAGQGAVDSAAGRLDRAGQGVGQAAEVLVGSTADMAASASAMAQAAQAIGSGLAEQQATVMAMGRLVADLRSTVETAKREANLSGQLLGRMEAASGVLAEASHAVDGYLHGISGVLATAHENFGEQLEASVGRAHAQFQQQMTQAIEALKGAVEDLSDALAVMEPRP